MNQYVRLGGSGLSRLSLSELEIMFGALFACFRSLDCAISWLCRCPQVIHRPFSWLHPLTAHIIFLGGFISSSVGTKQFFQSTT